MMKLLFAIVLITCAYGGYYVLNSAARAILRGNVSKTRYRKIRKEISFSDKIRLNYILPYAKWYAGALKKIIFFAKLCYVNFLITAVLAVILLILNADKGFYFLLLLSNWIFVNAPTSIFMFVKSYHNWRPGESHDWRYAVDGKYRRRNKLK